ncbi:MAG: ATP-binding protein [Deltaproteobacteria bacterium]|jgi:predicted AAA+ superfamily ATPase|nr:ATP-binding protein [Deltaproteobacteria bacterium]
MIKRKSFLELVDHLPQKEMSLIIGPRQAGKTTLMEMLKEHLDKIGERTLLLNLDIEWDRPHFESQAALIKKIELEIGHQHGYVFIDEIQRKEDAGLFLKGLSDLKLPYKFILSGSGSLELKQKIHESLIGRKRLFELSTVSFEEFINHRTDYRYEENLADFLTIEKDRAQQLLSEYMQFGGYPRIIMAAEKREKLRLIDEIYRSVLEKDIAYLLKLDKPDVFSALIKILGGQIGQLMNHTELASALNVSFTTVKKYLWYAQKIFLVELMAPYARNVRKEISKSPVPYFWDLGLRNYSLGLFGHLESPIEKGFVFENLVFLILRQKLKFTSAKLNYWRTKDKAEVDFVIEAGQRLIPVEVKYKHLKQDKVPVSLRRFIDKYNPEQAYIINLDLSKIVKIKKTSLFFMPFHELLRQTAVL